MPHKNLTGSAYDELRKTLLENPDASKHEVRIIVKRFVARHQSAFQDVFEYWFENIFRRLEVIHKQHSATVKTKLAAIRRKGKKTGKAVVEKLKFALMDHVLTSGKLLRFATFADCEREGGWLRDVARQGKPTQVVGNVLTEQQLLNLKGRNSSTRLKLVA